jgi:hypothetical protein
MKKIKHIFSLLVKIIFKPKITFLVTISLLPRMTKMEAYFYMASKLTQVHSLLE